MSALLTVHLPKRKKHVGILYKHCFNLYLCIARQLSMKSRVAAHESIIAALISCAAALDSSGTALESRVAALEYHRPVMLLLVHT